MRLPRRLRHQRFFFFCFIPFITIATYMETLIEGTTDGRYTWQCLCFCHATARGIPCTTKQDQRCGKNLGASQTKRGGSQRRSGIRKTKRAKKKKCKARCRRCVSLTPDECCVPCCLSMMLRERKPFIVFFFFNVQNCYKHFFCRLSTTFLSRARPFIG